MTGKLITLPSLASVRIGDEGGVLLRDDHEGSNGIPSVDGANPVVVARVHADTIAFPQPTSSAVLVVGDLLALSPTIPPHEPALPLEDLDFEWFLEL